MKKAFVIFVLITIAFVGALLIAGSREERWQPKTQLTFLGFVNTNAGVLSTNALFDIAHLPTGETRWDVVEISHKEGTDWIGWLPLPALRLSWRYTYHTNSFAPEAIVPVPTTNTSLRIVFELRRGPRGAVQRLLRDLRVRWARLIRSNSRSLWDGPGPIFLITNEINLAPVNHL